VVADPCDENATGDKDWRGEERRDKGDNGIYSVVGVEVVVPDPAAWGRARHGFGRIQG